VPLAREYSPHAETRRESNDIVPQRLRRRDVGQAILSGFAAVMWARRFSAASPPRCEPAILSGFAAVM